MVAAVALTCGSTVNAEDAVQEAIRRAWERGQAGEEFNSLAAWVAVVAMNLTRSGLRRKLAESRALGRIAALPTADVSEETVEVTGAVRRLPRRQREAIILHYWLDLPVEEIAERLGLSAGAVKNALFRARRTLAKSITEEVEA